jgi:hypothetical protein
VNFIPSIFIYNIIVKPFWKIKLIFLFWASNPQNPGRGAGLAKVRKLKDYLLDRQLQLLAFDSHECHILLLHLDGQHSHCGDDLHIAIDSEDLSG